MCHGIYDFVFDSAEGTKCHYAPMDETVLERPRYSVLNDKLMNDSVVETNMGLTGTDNDTGVDQTGMAHIHVYI